MGASVYGSEHVLLGLLSAAGPATQHVLRAYPQLSVDAVRAAVTDALDDREHLHRLGIDPDLLDGGPPAGAGPALPVVLRAKHTAEFQVALNDAFAKWGQLVKQRALPRRTKLTSTELWLVVVEPAARAHRLLQVLDADPDQVRAVVLASMIPEQSAPPTWPTQARVGAISRLFQRFFERVNIAR